VLWPNGGPDRTGELGAGLMSISGRLSRFCIGPKRKPLCTRDGCGRRGLRSHKAVVGSSGMTGVPTLQECDWESSQGRNGGKGVKRSFCCCSCRGGLASDAKARGSVEEVSRSLC
jgi:hypothetical protein